jgi:hypothetical protein
MDSDDVQAEECRRIISSGHEPNFHDLLGVLLEVYIDNVVIKSVCFTDHLADLRVALERMRKYGLKMNPFKCVFGVFVGRFLRFIVHEHGIQIDPKKIESIWKFEQPASKRDVQKLLGKINYLRHFIANLVGKVDPLLPLVRLHHEKYFVWGQEHRGALERIREYITNSPMLKTPKISESFRLYVSAQEHVIGVSLTQENDGKEAPMADISQKLLDAYLYTMRVPSLGLTFYQALAP